MKVSDFIKPVLLELADRQEKWTLFWEVKAFEGIPPKMRQAVIRKLIKKGYSGGCDCGCRADLCITDEGLALINRLRTHPYNGY